MANKMMSILLFVVTMVRSTNGVGIGASCSMNSDCESTNVHSHCYNWLTADSCPNGACRCNAGYSGNTCIPSPLIMSHGELCNSNWTCALELHCDEISRRCVCATSTYVFKPAINTCQAHKARVINESCQTTDECYNFGGAEGGIECFGTLKKTCQCKPGYVEIVGICYIPHLGQPCNTGVGCTTMSHPDYRVLSTHDLSRTKEICNGTECVCPPDSEAVALNVFGTLLMYCLKRPDGHTKAAGQTCQSSSECASKVCYSCPGSQATSRKCVTVPTGSAPATFQPTNVILTTTGVLIAAMFIQCLVRGREISYRF